ncbi:MAG: zinc ribbon domain-containing protein [Deltaproteobacteria bacterium]|nr:zinc ribbon domain-containing protein [Deltaproteobacteria bacterium]
MPLYEYHCPSCDLTFEVLTSLSEALKKKPCPECGRRAPRIVSAFAIASGGNGHHDSAVAPVAQQPRDPRPPCMKYPQVPLSCHMDEPSLRRFVAHAQGRGSEYDDKMAKQAEIRKQRGIPEPVVAPPAHGHDHGHDRNLRRHAVTQGHGHDHGHGHAKGKAHSHTHGTPAH